MGEGKYCPRWELLARQPWDSSTKWLAAIPPKKNGTRFGALNVPDHSGVSFILSAQAGSAAGCCLLVRVVRGVAMTYSEVCCGVSGSGPEFVLLYCVTTASLLQLHQYNVSHSFSKRVSLPILGHVHVVVLTVFSPSTGSGLVIEY